MPSFNTDYVYVPVYDDQGVEIPWYLVTAEQSPPGSWQRLFKAQEERNVAALKAIEYGIYGIEIQMLRHEALESSSE